MGMGQRGLSFRWALYSARDRHIDSMTSPTAPPAPALAIATALSILMHLMVITSWPQPPSPGRAADLASPLKARLAQSTLSLEAPNPRLVPEAKPAAVPIARAPTQNQPVLPLAAPAPLPPEADIRPEPIFPIEALTRLPALVTEITQDDWPSTPGAPSGSFRIEVDVGPDGRVMRVKSVCEPKICEAAATYAGTITGWRFTPAEILGHRVSSRIHIEFEIGSPESEGFIATPISPQTLPSQ